MFGSRNWMPKECCQELKQDAQISHRLVLSSGAGHIELENKETSMNNGGDERDMNSNIVFLSYKMNDDEDLNRVLDAQ